jgi:hypothetical protein
VELKRNSKYRIEKPAKPQPKWKRNNNGRLVSNLPRRPNIGGLGDLEAFYHVKRGDGEVLPPPQALWRQRYGDQQTVSYRPLWVDIAGNLADPLRRRSDVSESGGDKNGNVGLPYLYTYDETVELDEHWHQYRRWQPLQILANGGYGVVITYVDEARGFTVSDEIAHEDRRVAKFNYKGGDLVDIVSSVVDDITMSEEIRRSQRKQDEEGAADSPPAEASRVARRAARRASQAARRAEVEERIRNFNEEARRSKSRAARSGRRRRSSDDSHSSDYSHFQTPTPGLDVDVTDTFRMENQIPEMMDMTGSPHFPKFWKLADPPQDGTLCTMEYIPGGLTLFEHFDLLSNQKVPIRLLWQAILCISKAMSVMAYGSEDPAPSHRVHGWNQIVHLDWSKDNIFVRTDSPSHTCSHGPCFMAGDFRFALIVPNKPKARAEFRLGHLKLGWHSILNERLPVSSCHDFLCKP